MDTTDVRQDVLAYYQELVSQIPQSPTICFSKAPDIVPVWAHYAHNLSGFIVEIDEQQLDGCKNNLNFEDVEYSSNPVFFNASEVGQTYGMGKPRHTYFIMRKAFSSAYFTKNECWSYERSLALPISPQIHREHYNTKA